LARLAQAYLDSRRVDSAYKTIEAALGQEPRNPYALMLKGELLLRDERFQEALPLFQAAIREDPSISLAYLKAGYILVKSQRLEEAERVLRDGLKRDPHNPGLHLQLAETFYLRPSAPGAAADAEKHYQLAIPDNPAAANAHSRLGELALRRGDEPTARTHFEKAVELDPFLPDALYGLGRLEAKSGNTKRSDALLRQAKLRRDAATRLGELKARAQANPEDPDLACRVARYALEHNLLAEAERQVERAVRWKPDHAEARRLRADLYSRQARLEEARNEYRVAGAL
jgi:tetratricopeptide (TPR) repeat protein